MNAMKIQYLGTAAAEGFPAVFCNCGACTRARADLPAQLRTRSQMLIDGTLLVDFPPDTYMHTLRFGFDLSAVRTLLVTHSHTDHFYAQEFVNRGYKFAQGMRAEGLDLFANKEVLSVFAEGTRREMRQEVSEHIRLHAVRPFERFMAGEYEIIALPAEHTPQEEALIYCISRGGKSLLYCNDTGLLDEKCYAFLAECGVQLDAVSFDCTFADTAGPHSSRHMGFAENDIVCEKLAIYGIISPDAKYYVTHFSHNSAPFRERIEKEAERRGYIAAYDGMTALI